jgi:hypothetical protein
MMKKHLMEALGLKRNRAIQNFKNSKTINQTKISLLKSLLLKHLTAVTSQ